ncbi:MAG: 16S rRNA (adenine(1518)-N(6)/adenine(1519)-N(6))-dimethyltransferase RsmA [Anaerolineae bacterium]
MEVATLLKQYGLRPKKSLGQNFLIDEHALAQIVVNAEVTHDDVVLEIGPGLGSLTRHLAEAARHVIAVEIDRTLIPPLESVVAEYPNVSIVQGDILQLDPTTLLSPYFANESARYKVVANIPYYITSAIIRQLLEAPIKPKLIVLTVQLEVAQRLSAQPDDMNLLAVSVQFYGQPRIVQRVKAGAFYPAPDVDSAVVRIDLPDEPRYAVSDVDAFFRVVKAGFSQKRKQLHNALRAGLALPTETILHALEAAQIDSKRRAETVTIEEWVRLTETLKAEG